ncbi:MAG TPA: hypothetical protein VF513_14155, partial [Stenotrophomonas sp.]
AKQMVDQVADMAVFNDAGFAAYAAPTIMARLMSCRESPCRAWLGTTLPPFDKAKGWVGEGLAFRGLI